MRIDYQDSTDFMKLSAPSNFLPGIAKPPRLLFRTEVDEVCRQQGPRNVNSAERTARVRGEGRWKYVLWRVAWLGRFCGADGRICDTESSVVSHLDPRNRTTHGRRQKELCMSDYRW